MKVNLIKSRDILTLSEGDAVAKRNLFDLIQYSKVEDSPFWDGFENRIGNTPQQGINWLGPIPNCNAVLIKTRLGSYSKEGWVDGGEDFYQYSFKSVQGHISYAEKANGVLINQPTNGYPILLFIESGDGWIYQGKFGVAEIHDDFVVLSRNAATTVLYEEKMLEETEDSYTEGDRRYVTHLMAERNKKVVSVVKSKANSACDICGLKLLDYYGFDCIEAHHKKPISNYSSSYVVNAADFALLCPSCHRVVHKYMRVRDDDYLRLKELLVERFRRYRT